MKILAIDLGTTTGYAFGDSETCEYGSKNFKPLPQESEGMRYLKFQSWLVKTVKEFKPDEVVYEEVIRAHVSTNAAHIYGGLRSDVLKVCAAMKIPCHGINVMTLKKHATGKGNAKKDKMIEAAKKLGYNPKDDNEADAIHIYHYAKDLFSGRLVA